MIIIIERGVSGTARLCRKVALLNLWLLCMHDSISGKGGDGVKKGDKNATKRVEPSHGSGATTGVSDSNQRNIAILLNGM
jgi:hypothetical protein